MVAIENIDMPECCGKCFAYCGAAGGLCMIGDYGGPKYITNCIVDIDREYWCPLRDVGNINIEKS